MSDFKAKMHQIVCRLGLRVYSVYFVYLYILCNWPLPLPLLQNRSSAHGQVAPTEQERATSRWDESRRHFWCAPCYLFVHPCKLQCVM